MGLLCYAVVAAVIGISQYILTYDLKGLITGLFDPEPLPPPGSWRTRQVEPWTNDPTLLASADVVKFDIHFPDSGLDDLQQRLQNYRGWDETTPMNHSDDEHWTWGIPQANLSGLVKHWQIAYDWREHEREINQDLYATHIDGLRIVFKHIKPVESDQMQLKPPVLLLHGWPGSIVEFQTLQGLLQADGHPLVIPCIPGYGYSTAPQREGYDVFETATTYHKLMDRLGYERFLIQGGDWGAMVLEAIVHADPPRVIGAHTNFAQANQPPNLLTLAQVRLFDSEEDRRRMTVDLPQLLSVTGYMHLQASRPETLGAALSDSPVGLLAWICEKFHAWSDPSHPLLDKFSADELITNIMMYWTSNSFTSSARYYKENLGRPNSRTPLVVSSPWPATVPVGVAMFPFEILPPPTRYVKAKYHTEVVHKMDEGGHFAAAEKPELLHDSFRRFVAYLEEL